VKAQFNRLMRLYAIGTAFYLAAYKQLRWRWWPLPLLSNFLVWLTLPAALLFSWMTLRGRWKDAMLLAPTAAYFGLQYAARYMPRPVKQYIGRRLKVFTYNLHAEEQNLEQMATVILSTGADIIALQEVSHAAEVYFAEKLTAQFPYQRIHHGETSETDGQGVLSRFPICESEYWQNPINSFLLGHQRVVIQWDDVPITIFNLHPIHPGLVDGKIYDETPRGQEIEFALRRSLSELGAVIWMGDFNMCDESDDYARITQYYRDVFREQGQGLGFTFPDLNTPQARFENSYPTLPIRLVRLDFIFVNEWWATADAKVWHTSGGSDHRPVWAQLVLTSPRPM
jgi:vancomycin resistance protein VanJ